jgi:hypothetical protein
MKHCNELLTLELPAGVLRYVSVNGKTLRENVDKKDLGRKPQPVVMVQEHTLNSRPLYFEHVEILGDSALVVDYKQKSPHHQYHVACLRTMAALRVHCSRETPESAFTDLDGFKIVGC